MESCLACKSTGYNIQFCKSTRIHPLNFKSSIIMVVFLLFNLYSFSAAVLSDGKSRLKVLIAESDEFSIKNIDNEMHFFFQLY